MSQKPEPCMVEFLPGHRCGKVKGHTDEHACGHGTASSIQAQNSAQKKKERMDLIRTVSSFLGLLVSLLIALRVFHFL